MQDSTFVPSPISESKSEYIYEDHDSVKFYESNDYTIGYQLSGSCRILSDDTCIEVEERTLFLVDKGSYRIEALTGCKGDFEQILFNLDSYTIFGPSSRDRSRREQRFQHAVLNGIITSLTIEDLASRCCISLSTFKRHFNERFAHSPHRWFVRCRLDIAERVATQANISVADLAAICGFSNASHFIHAFRSRFGATPSRHTRRRYSRRSLYL